jgi:oxygen-dependent protoporphyrinogen oxidase
LSAAEVDAVVVGAGIAGLAAALELQAHGCEVVIIDPSDRPGGVMRTDHVSGFVIERGPNTTLVSAEMDAFLKRHALVPALRPAEPESRSRFLVRGGRMVPVPTSPGALVRSELLSGRAKLRLLSEPFRRRGPAESESVAEFVGRRLGPEVASALVGPFLTGVYAGDENELGAEAVFPKLVEHERRHGSIAWGALLGALQRTPRGRPGSWSTDEGLGPFARRLAGQLTEPPALGSRVIGIGRDARGWRVEVVSATGDTSLRARRVVVATPSLEAAHLLRGVSGDVAAALEAIRYAPVVGVPVAVDPERVRAAIEGFGFLVPADEGMELLGCLFMSRLFPSRAPEGRELLHCMIGGTRWPDAANAQDDDVISRVFDALHRVLGLDEAPEVLAVSRYARAIPQPARDHAARIRWTRSMLEETPGIALAGAYLDGVSVCASLTSGVEAARSLL